MGLFLLALVLGFAAVSYVAALRAARRSGHAHEAAARVGRPHAITRSRNQALGRVRRRFRKPARAEATRRAATRIA